MSAPVKTRIAIVAGSTRPGRKSASVARWVLEHAEARASADYEVVDLEDFALPHLDEEIPAVAGRYAHAHTKKWAERIAGFDGFVFVTPEYNHGVPGALKDAIDFLFAEWNDKAAAFVSYGVVGGVRAVEQLRLNLATVGVATVGASVALGLSADFEGGAARPAASQATALGEALDGLEAWSGALATLRVANGERAA